MIGIVGLLGFVKGIVTDVVVGIGTSVSTGFVGVMVIGLVKGTVTIVGVGLFGWKETSFVEVGVIRRVVVSGMIYHVMFSFPTNEFSTRRKKDLIFFPFEFFCYKIFHY